MSLKTRNLKPLSGSTRGSSGAFVSQVGTTYSLHWVAGYLHLPNDHHDRLRAITNINNVSFHTEKKADSVYLGGGGGEGGRDW